MTTHTRRRPLSEPQRRTLQLLDEGGHLKHAVLFVDAVGADGVTRPWHSVGNTFKALHAADLIERDTAREPKDALAQVWRINARGRRALRLGLLDPGVRGVLAGALDADRPPDGPQLCPACRGTGYTKAFPPAPCPECRGGGEVWAGG